MILIFFILFLFVLKSLNTIVKFDNNCFERLYSFEFVGDELENNAYFLNTEYLHLSTFCYDEENRIVFYRW